MAKIQEEIIIIKVSKLVRDSEADCPKILSSAVRGQPGSSDTRIIGRKRPGRESLKNNENHYLATAAHYHARYTFW